MAGLPKKYAKMGFKKGWEAYKALKNKAPKATKRKTATKKVYGTMAKKRSYKKSKKATSKNMMGGFLGKVITKALPIAYGYAREPLSDWLAKSPLGKALPNFGKYGDEATLLMLNYGATALGARKNVYARKARQIVEVTELASVGREVYLSRNAKISNEDF